MNQISIALRMLLILKASKVIKKEELADRLEISTKMVQRLKVQLQDAGYDINVIAGKYGGYQLVNSSFLPINNISAQEIESLAKAYPYIKSLKHLHLDNEFHDVYEKIIANQSRGIDTIASTQPRSLTIHQDQLEKLISTLQDAIVSKTRIKLQYNNKKEYVFEPYEIFQIDIFWYVIGYLHLGDIRTFRINRILNIDSTQQRFIRDEHFNLQSHLNNQGFKIEKPITVKGFIQNRNYLMEIVHSDHQVFKVIDDQSFEFEITFYTSHKAKSFVLENGSDITIKSPQSLIDFQQQEAQKILTKYDSIE